MGVEKDPLILIVYRDRQAVHGSFRNCFLAPGWQYKHAHLLKLGRIQYRTSSAVHKERGQWLAHRVHREGSFTLMPPYAIGCVPNFCEPGDSHWSTNSVSLRKRSLPGDSHLSAPFLGCTLRARYSIRDLSRWLTIDLQSSATYQDGLRR
jgi:hypothetical protein